MPPLVPLAPVTINLGSLPPAARARFGAGPGSPTWASNQSVGEEMALRRLGFVSLGIVMGSVNSWGVPFRARPAPPRTGMGLGQGQIWIDDPMSARRRGGYMHDGAVGPDGKPSMTMSWTWERVLHEQRERQLIDKAMSHLMLEARALGAHGVIGMELSVRRLGTDTTTAYPILEVLVRGTAVGVPGAGSVHNSFTTGLSGADLLKLAEHGWAPVLFCVGLGEVIGTSGRNSRRTLRSIQNGEVEQLSEITQKSLEIALHSLEQQATGRCDLVVGVATNMEVRSYDTHIRVTGSAICRMHGGNTSHELSFIPVVTLSD